MRNYIFIVIIIIIIIILILLYLLTQQSESFTNTNNKPYLWVYWENVNGKKIPDYIALCLDTIKKHGSTSFNLVILNNHNIYTYLPELKEKEKLYNLHTLRIAHKVDYYRLLLLKKYGGLYLDADIILMKDPKEIIDKLKDYDFVGFGCTGNICHNGYGRPSNWALGSRANGQLMTECVRLIEDKLKDNKVGKVYDYHEFGKLLIWQALRNLEKNQNYKYYHYASDVTGTRNKTGQWITNDNFFSNQSIDYADPSKLIFIVLYNSGIDNFKNISKDYLLKSDLNISKFLRKSLYDKN